MGDSKTAEAEHSGLATWQTELKNYNGGNTYARAVPDAAMGTYTVALMQANIDAWLARVVRNDVDVVLWNLGANDAPNAGTLNETTWKANVLYCWDAIHAKYPNATLYIARVWRRGYASECDTVNGWYDDLMPLRAFVADGHDERIWLENGDDGATYTTEGLHYNAAGNTKCVEMWRGVFG